MDKKIQIVLTKEQWFVLWDVMSIERDLWFSPATKDRNETIDGAIFVGNMYASGQEHILGGSADIYVRGLDRTQERDPFKDAKEVV